MLLTSLKSYNRTQFVKDVTAGIIVAIIPHFRCPLHLHWPPVSDRKPESSRPSLRDLLSLHLVEAVYRLPDRPLHFATIVAGIVAKDGLDGLVISTILCRYLPDPDGPLSLRKSDQIHFRIRSQPASHPESPLRSSSDS